jgi:hypothetical protein
MLKTTFEVEPYRRVSIRTVQNIGSSKVFFENLAAPVPKGAGARFGPILWANGVVFSFAPYAPSDSVSKEHLSGHLPWDNLDFAPMPKYEREVQISGREVTFFLKDVTSHSLFGPLTKWIATDLLGRRARK